MTMARTDNGLSGDLDGSQDAAQTQGGIASGDAVEDTEMIWGGNT